MKSFKLAGIIILGLAVSACASLTQKAAEEIAPLIADYCESESQSQREIYRTAINAELAADGHAVNITCRGDS